MLWLFPLRHWIRSKGEKKFKADVLPDYYTQSETLLGDADLRLSFWQKRQFWKEAGKNSEAARGI